jgi:hypothetical protein
MTHQRLHTLLTFVMLALVFAAPTRSHAQTYTSLYEFGGKTGDPTQPQYSGVIAQGRDGCTLRRRMVAVFALSAAPYSRSHPRARSRLFTTSMTLRDQATQLIVA